MADATQRAVVEADLGALQRGWPRAEKLDASFYLGLVEQRVKQLTDQLEEALRPLGGVLSRMPVKRLDSVIGEVQASVDGDGRSLTEYRFVCRWLAQDAGRDVSLPAVPVLDRATGEMLVDFGRRLISLSESLDGLDVRTGGSKRHGSGLFSRCETILRELEETEEDNS